MGILGPALADTTVGPLAGSSDLTATANSLFGLFLAVSVVLPLAVIAGRLICRSLLVARTRAGLAPGRPELLSPDRLECGWAGTVQPCAPSGDVRLNAEISAIDRKYVVLAADLTGPAMALGTPVRAFVVGQTCAYTFHSTVRDCVRRDGADYLYLERPAWVEKVQRRDYFRVAATIPATVSVIDGESAGSAASGLVRDISGGGFAIRVPAAMAPGTRIRLRLSDEALGVTSYEARVLRCSRAVELTRSQYIATCELVHLTEDDRSRIVRYCFDVQRQQP